MVGTSREAYKVLEQRFADWLGVKHAIAVSNGTAALHLGLLSLGVGPGDEVIVPDFTMAACAFAVSYTGATPVFVDCDDNLSIDVRKIEKAITPKTKAIMAVHIYARPCNMKKILELSARHKIPVIEDAAEAHGNTYLGRKLGTLGDVGCFSLYKNKIVAAEEGGLVVTDDDEIAKIVSLYKNMGFFVPRGKGFAYQHAVIGYNYRMSNAMATMALSSLRKIHENTAKRRQLWQVYDKRLGEYRVSECPEIPWVYDMILPDASWRDRVIDQVQGAREFFSPLSAQPAYKEFTSSRPSKSLQASYTGCYLSVSPDLSLKDVENICQQVLSLRLV